MEILEIHEIVGNVKENIHIEIHWLVSRYDHIGG